MNVIPLQNRILIKPAPTVKKTEFGIVIPDAAVDKPSQAKVMAVGPGIVEENELNLISIAVGDVIMYNKHAGTKVEVNGTEMLIIGEDDVIAIVRENA